MPIRPDLAYHAHLAAGRFMLPADAAGRAFYPPRATAPGTADQEVGWIEASGRGTVYSATIVRRRPPDADYNVVLVDLTEGPRMMSRVEGIAPDGVAIGMAVVARIRAPADGDPYIVFEPA